MSDTDMFAAMDDLAEWATEHASDLAELDRAAREQDAVQVIRLRENGMAK